MLESRVRVMTLRLIEAELGSKEMAHISIIVLILIINIVLLMS